MLVRILIFISLISCTKYNEIKKQSGAYYLTGVYNEISFAKNIEWDIGRKREVTISKGLRFTTTISKVSDNAKNFLRKKFGVDSWIIRLSRKRRGYSQGIGYFYVLLENMTRTTKDYTINLYYHAAAVSKRFRLFHCPAFNHRFEVTSFKIQDRPKAVKKDLYIRAVERFPGKATRLRFAPMVLSGGVSLKGDYFIDMAMYNTKKKMRYSEWLAVDGNLQIAQERSRSVASCLGVKEEHHPLKESKLPSIKDFEIK